mgnify:CR=1 FL=1
MVGSNTIKTASLEVEVEVEVEINILLTIRLAPLIIAVAVRVQNTLRINNENIQIKSGLLFDFCDHGLLKCKLQ